MPLIKTLKRKCYCTCFERQQYARTIISLFCGVQPFRFLAKENFVASEKRQSAIKDRVDF